MASAIAMSSSKTLNRLRLAQRIQLKGSPSQYPCQFCEDHQRECIVMPDQLKCSECTRRGRPCVSLSWDRVEDAYKRSKIKVELLEAEQSQLLDRLDELRASLRTHRKILEKNSERADNQMHCLVREMEADGEDLTHTVIEASQLEFNLFGAPEPSSPRTLTTTQGS